MESAEAQLREIKLALEYCDLDYKEIVEDYREHQKELKQKVEHQDQGIRLPKQIKRRSA